MIRCGHCKGTHPTTGVVRICSELHTRRQPSVPEVRYVMPGQPPVSVPQTTNTRDCNVKCDCHKGLVYLTGCFENGRWKGSTGKCYRCNGKGWQTPADQRRNYVYDTNYRKVYA